MPDVIPFVETTPGVNPGVNAGDPATRVRVLYSILQELGITDVLVASRRLLAREQELNLEGREAKMAAARRWAEHRERLLRGEVGAAETAAVLRENGPWLDGGPDGSHAAPAMIAMVDAQRDCRGRAAVMLEGEASGIYSRLQELATQVVARTASLPALPQRVWTAREQAGTVAIQAGHELEWARLVGEATRFEKIHQAAAILRQSGGLPVMVFPDGCPTGLGVLYLNWRPVLDGIAELKQHVGPLRLRFAVDRGWRPGLWVPADHQPPAPAPSLGQRALGFLVPSPLRSG